jgi:hypothetical protein
VFLYQNEKLPTCHSAVSPTALLLLSYSPATFSYSCHYCSVFLPGFATESLSANNIIPNCALENSTTFMSGNKWNQTNGL